MKGRPFRKRLRFAVAGVAEAWRGEASFRAQVLLAIIALIVTAAMRPGPAWAAIVAVSIALVLALEAISSALEAVIDHLHPNTADSDPRRQGHGCRRGTCRFGWRGGCRRAYGGLRRAAVVTGASGGAAVVAEKKTPSDRPDGEPNASEVLDALAAREGDRIPFSAVVDAAGSRVHGLALLVFVLPEVPPLPLPSASTVLAIPLIIISAHLALFGEGSLLPAQLQSASMPHAVFAAAARYLAPVFRWIERASRPRWLWLARQERLLGILCLGLSIILVLPIPFLNALPAACLAAVALGMIQRDGVFIAAGIVGALLVAGVLVGLIDAAGNILAR